jgi:hypothetical protein
MMHTALLAFIWLLIVVGGLTFIGFCIAGCAMAWRIYKDMKEDS